MWPTPPPGPVAARTCVRTSPAILATVAAAVALVPAAYGAPVVSGADGDVWNAANPDPVYVVTSDDGEPIRVSWSIPGVARGAGDTPLTVRPGRIGDGLHVLRVRDLSVPEPDDDDDEEDEDRPDPLVTRTFRVDRTPPRVVIRQPVAGLTVDQGAAVTVDFSCEDAVRCIGTVGPGMRLPTGTPGTLAFGVTGVDDAGNQASASVPYTVRPVATTGVSAARTALPATALRPRTLNASRLRPAPGTVVRTRRPLLRWTARPGARLYNVQIFMLRANNRTTKVLSVFPRGNRLRVPPRRLAVGRRYVWRVWPYVGGRYTARPLGVSHLRVAAPR